MSFSVIVFQWYFWGFSLAFSTTSNNPFIGDLKHFGLMKVWGAPSVGSPLIPALLYSFYQMMFCASVLSPSEAALCQAWSSSSSGLLLSTALSRTGSGTLMVGASLTAFSTTLVVFPSRSALACPHSPTLGFWAAAMRR
ncbi:hypothetical protein LB505_002763 [Fusarium chuoi]|nr:hypothetical protein LB505_002763 [Fusarium chuoi]